MTKFKADSFCIQHYDRLRADLSTWGFWGSVMACMSTTQNICESLFSSATFICWCFCDVNFSSFLFLFCHLEPFHPAFDGPKVVAQVEHPGWLDSRKRPRRRWSQFCHWRITAAVPLVWTWQRGVSHALWADCQEAQGGRGESRNRRVQLSTAKLSNTRQIHLNIWKVLWRCYHYLVRL